MLSDNGVLSLLGVTWSKIQRKKKIQFFFVIVVVVVSSFAEVASIGMLIPLVSLLVSPEAFNENKIIALVNAIPIDFLSINTIQKVIFIYLFILFFSVVIRIYSIKASAQFAHDIGAFISVSVFNSILNRDYIDYQIINSSEDIARIASKVNIVIQGLLFPAVMLFGACLMLVIILSFFIYIEPMLTVAIFVTLTVVYGITMVFFSKKLKRNSFYISKLQNKQVKNIKESLGSIRDIIITGSHKYFSSNYQDIENTLRSSQASNIIVAQSPRYIIEFIGMFFLLIFIAVYSAKGNEAIKIVLPTLFAVIVALQRIMPIAQQLYRSWANIVGNKDSLTDVLSVLKEAPESADKENLTPIEFKAFFELKDVCFSYPSSESTQLNGINLTIKKGQKIGIIGKSGSGKSTLIDIIMGLLQPTKGSFSVDGHIISKDNIGAWYKNISHVPQAIYLFDDTLQKNIIFASSEMEIIDKEKYAMAIKKSKVSDFVDENKDYSNMILGDEGGRLSGGQRQRVGIARGLYKNSPILILDEATSALDTTTEESVMKDICLTPELTVIAVAHRVSSLKYCDSIVEISGGKVSRILKYSEVEGLS